MQRRDFLKTVAAGFGACAVASGVSLGAAGAITPRRKPNIVLIYADDMGWGDVGYHGFKDVLTPNIDKLARTGVHFTQGYVTASVCGPSRCGLMSGVYQQRLGCGENSNMDGYPDKMRFPNSGVPTGQPLISEMLKKVGYRTGMIGKWHIGASPAQVPNARGFDYYYGFLNGSHDYYRWEGEFGKRKWLWPLFRNRKPLPAQDNVYLTDLFSQEACGFIERQKTDPFFLYLAYSAVHHPWQVPDKYLKRTRGLAKTKDKQYFTAMILAMDDGIGALRKSLEKIGQADNTIIIFISDNGSPRGQGLNHPKKDINRPRGGCTMSNPGPHRGFKGDTYEGGTKVPYLINWPGVIKPGTQYDLPVSSLDVAPFCLNAAGAKPIKGKFPLDGVDLLPFILGRNTQRPHKTMYWRRDNDYAIRRKDWKLTWNDASGTREIMLFNLKKDPGELINVVKDYPERAQAMQNAFDAWDSTLPKNACWGGPKTRNYNYAKGQRVKVSKQPYLNASGKVR